MIFRLRGIDFGYCVGASGLQGIFGEGYPYHRHLDLVPGFDFSGLTFTAKTVTLEKNNGNMPLREDGLTPLQYKPGCIYVSPRSWLAGAALNAVGLSNFGAEFYFREGRWQRKMGPFFLSFMSIKKDPKERIVELVKFVELLRSRLPNFLGAPALQINLSCPNVGLNPEHLIDEAVQSLDIASDLGIPLIPKINLLVPPHVAGRISKHPSCDALCVSNTLPWGSLPDRIDWKGIFGTTESPLQKKFGVGGGLSGAPLFPLLLEWLHSASGIVKKPIIAGGGILGPEDIYELSRTGAHVVPSIGSIAFLRPWNVKRTIRTAREVFAS